jgi:hypothetical protein
VVQDVAGKRWDAAAGGVRVGGQWLIKEKIIDPWNSATAPMVGHLP